MKANSKIVLFIIPLFFFTNFAFGSEFTNKKNIVDKNLKGSIAFEKKVKVLAAFQSWADKELTSNADKLNDEELTQVMQFSTLLKALVPKNITPKNCQAGIDKVIDEDLTPISEELSPPALKIIEWLKLTCAKTPANKQK